MSKEPTPETRTFPVDPYDTTEGLFKHPTHGAETPEQAADRLNAAARLGLGSELPHKEKPAPIAAEPEPEPADDPADTPEPEPTPTLTGQTDGIDWTSEPIPPESEPHADYIDTATGAVIHAPEPGAALAHHIDLPRRDYAYHLSEHDGDTAAAKAAYIADIRSKRPQDSQLSDEDVWSRTIEGFNEMIANQPHNTPHQAPGELPGMPPRPSYNGDPITSLSLKLKTAAFAAPMTQLDAYNIGSELSATVTLIVTGHGHDTKKDSGELHRTIILEVRDLDT